MLKKRGQVSTFVIICVLVLFVFVFIFMLRDSVREKFRGTVDREGYLISQMSQIKKSINACLAEESENAVKLLGESGGYFNPAEHVTYHGTKISVLCAKTPGAETCSAKPISIEQAAENLNNYLTTEIKNCIDLNPYRKKDYTLETGEFNLDIEIKDDEVITELNYPITLKLDAIELKNQDILNNLKKPLGKSINLANQIISNEANSGSFDVMGASLLSKGEYTIRERKSYPNKIYIIDFNERYKFNIGIQGES